MCLVLILLLKHNLSAVCVADILEVINLHCPQAGLIKHSLYLFRKFYNPSSVSKKKIFYCSGCHTGLDSEEGMCNICQVRNGTSYFVQLPLIPQLRKMFKRPQFFTFLQHRLERKKCHDECIEDIYDGSLYKEHTNSGESKDCFFLSFLYNTDGTPVYSALNFSFWGFYLCVNELPFRVRFKRENVLLGGLWFGPEQPNANLFLKSFCPDFQKLFCGVHFPVPGLIERLLVKAFLLAGTCDMPAKCKFLNVCSFNGFYGCSVCEASGETFIIGPRRHVHVYPYQRHCKMRTVDESAQYARQAIQSKKPVMGVKGPCYLQKLMKDYLKGMGIDFMHLLSNLVKKMMQLHFHESYSKFPFSLRPVVAVINARLLGMKPPKFVHRMPRSVLDLAHWKASEMKVWFFYYSPVVFYNVMRQNYYAHYMKAVIALSYLSSSHISSDNIVTAEALLHEFCSEFQELYGVRHCTITIHSLLHLPSCTRTLGPLWAYTCFPFENLNGELVRCLHGTGYVESQICNIHWHVLSSAKRFLALPAGPVRDFCLSQRRQCKIADRIADGCYSVGLYHPFDDDCQTVLEAMNFSGICQGRCLKFYRLLKDNILYVSEQYPRSMQCKSSFASYSVDDNDFFGNILCFVKLFQGCSCMNTTACACDIYYYTVVREVIIEGQYSIPRHKASLNYMYKCSLGQKVSVIPVTSLETVCFYLDADGESYLAEPVNCMECE